MARAVPKVSKASVEYGPAGEHRDRCGRCRHFEQPNACELVAGAINRNDWCRLFDPVRKVA